MIVEYIRYKLTQHATDSHEAAFGGFEATYRTVSSSLATSPHCLWLRTYALLAEAANVAVFMASDKARGMTGTTVNLTLGSLDD